MLRRTAIVVVALVSAVCSADALDHYFAWPVPAYMATPAVPADNPMSEAKVDLGRHLFYDARLSRDGSVACASCHDHTKAFTDGRPVSLGINGTVGKRNAPSLGNVGYMPQLTWGNPHMDSPEKQALVPLFGDNPLEMGSAGRDDAIFKLLAADPYYAEAFPASFPDHSQIDLFTVTRAIGAFQRTLISLNSPYDRYKYWGEADAISPEAKRGEQLFFSHRLECYHCHTGVLFTDNMQSSRTPVPELGNHNNGLYNLDGKGAYPATATGFFEFTGNPADMGRFRTPSLRNVGVTAPYFHDGSAATLADVIDHYAAAGRTITEGPSAGDGARNPFKDPLIVGFKITDEEKADLIAFLDSLTDESFLTNPAYSDPWPEGHPATINRVMP